MRANKITLARTVSVEGLTATCNFKLETYNGDNYYVSVSETAKALKAILKNAGFEVISSKSSSFSMGNSVDILIKSELTREQILENEQACKDYYAGLSHKQRFHSEPRQKLVDNLEFAFKAGSFDGYDDCYNYKTTSNVTFEAPNGKLLELDAKYVSIDFKADANNATTEIIEEYQEPKQEEKQEEVKTYPQVLEGQDINRFPPSKTILDEVQELSNMKLSSDCFETDEDDQDESEDMGNILENDYEQKSITELEMAKLIEEAHDRREVKVGDKARVQTLRNRMTFTGPRFVNEILTGTVKAINCHTLEFECNGQVHIIPRESVQDLIRI